MDAPAARGVREQVAILAQVIGRDVSFIEMSPQQARQQMISSVPESVVDGLLALLADAVGKPATVLPTVEQVSGRPPRTFAQWAAEHVADFRAG